MTRSSQDIRKYWLHWETVVKRCFALFQKKKNPPMLHMWTYYIQRSHPVIQFLSLYFHRNENEFFSELPCKSFFQWTCLPDHPKFSSSQNWFCMAVWDHLSAHMLSHCKVCRRTEMGTQPALTCCAVLQILTQCLKTRDWLSHHSHKVFMQSSSMFYFRWLAENFHARL